MKTYWYIYRSYLQQIHLHFNIYCVIVFLYRLCRSLFNSFVYISLVYVIFMCSTFHIFHLFRILCSFIFVVLLSFFHSFFHTCKFIIHFNMLPTWKETKKKRSTIVLFVMQWHVVHVTYSILATHTIVRLTNVCSSWIVNWINQRCRMHRYMNNCCLKTMVHDTRVVNDLYELNKDTNRYVLLFLSKYLQ